MEGGLVAAMLSMLGLEEKDVKDSDKLASFGVDSMQLAEIRSRLQRAMGRPIPLEEVSCLSGSAPRHDRTRSTWCVLHLRAVQHAMGRPN